ncbi:MAG: ArsR family transcriptional regulator [Rhodobacteraceae bacterium]|nr:ArsR family transcriptional regulator [Paracoccaceae bacterium]
MDLGHARPALAGPTRRAIVAQPARGASRAGELAPWKGLNQPAVSCHLKVLEQAGLIETRVAGTARPRRLRPEAIRDLWDWLGAYRAAWEGAFGRLDAVLDEMEASRTEKVDAP